MPQEAVAYETIYSARVNVGRASRLPSGGGSRAGKQVCRWLRQRICLVLEIMPEHQAFEGRLCHAPAFGVRQLAGAFARGMVEIEAAWLELAEKRADQSPQSKAAWRFASRRTPKCARRSTRAGTI